MKTRPRPRLIIRHGNEINEGESIEQKMEKILTGKEGVELTRSPLYQERREGVADEYNIRADKHEILREAVELSTKKYFEARELRGKKRHGEKPELSGGAESTRTGEPGGSGNN